MAKVYATYEEAARSSSYTYYKIRVAISTESVPQLVKKALGFGTLCWDGSFVKDSAPSQDVTLLLPRHSSVWRAN
ncbi:hypothetical protein OsJ_10785 [Oryza sativa Japonica Group]|uniref:Uncharacterized protein n=2 Tax=Oryza sativa subsp. japonica TaxID=39947 RepID=A0A8J8YPG1_ORYSJ|nr:hypothetical protein LOC_Os03g22150 [Oryza sativa Japonica Group]EAZ26866.1 hypothetical protein OsJ_10785 [Oryza sativa Japonica Group]